MEGVRTLSMRRARDAGFAIAAVGFAVALVLLAAVAYLAPVDISLDHAPKVAYAMFAFAFGMLIGLFADKEGFRRPTRAEMRRRLPLVIGSLLLCIAVLGWLGQLRSFTQASDDLAKACQILRTEPQEDIYGPIANEKSMRAEQRAIIAAHRISGLWAVRHPEVEENAPCD